jgi:hypothetical protein
MDTKPMEHQKAEALKDDLRRAAERGEIDLSLSENKFTLWEKQGGQGYTCRERGAYPDKIYRFLGQYHLFGTAAVVILEENGQRVRLITCEIG